MNRSDLLKAIKNKTGWAIPQNIFCFPDDAYKGRKTTLEDDGCHRIVVSLEGNLAPFSPTIIFQGWDRNGFACYVYAYGGAVVDSRYVFDFNKAPFSQVEAHTSFDCERFDATIAFLNTNGITSNIGVLCQGYFNNKLVIEECKTFYLSSQILCNFEYFDSKEGFKTYNLI